MGIRNNYLTILMSIALSEYSYIELLYLLSCEIPSLSFVYSLFYIDILKNTSDVLR